MKTKSPAVMFGIALALCACAPSPSAVATAIVQTEQARPANTPTALPPSPPSPTLAPTRAATPTTRASLEELQQRLTDPIARYLEARDDVESLTLIRFNNGALEVELKTVWASKDRQPDVSFDIVKNLAAALIVQGQFTSESASTLAGGPFHLVVVTYSTNGDYRYQSDTPFELLDRLSARSVSYDEWVVEAEAGFK